MSQKTLRPLGGLHSEQGTAVDGLVPLPYLEDLSEHVLDENLGWITRLLSPSLLPHPTRSWAVCLSPQRQRSSSQYSTGTLSVGFSSRGSALSNRTFGHLGGDSETWDWEGS
ncbi:hypothetical protein SAY86_019502 [Trapa natans]|uniref:Uncharacterized protein n=1 Tax=Trapa natans TaxID=22666 RepID=A0AAN7LXN3_TRANT|nr:hypothetical protein SAY86_019502 [Trapa natans]